MERAEICCIDTLAVNRIMAGAACVRGHRAEDSSIFGPIDERTAWACVATLQDWNLEHAVLDRTLVWDLFFYFVSVAAPVRRSTSSHWTVDFLAKAWRVTRSNVDPELNIYNYWGGKVPRARS